MATAGVIIASAMVEEEATAVAVETTVDAVMQPIVAVAHRWYAPAAVAGPAVMPPQVAPAPLQRVAARPMVLPMLEQRVVARPMVAPMPEQRVVARPMAAPMPEQRSMAATNATRR
jgi:hypothetical protein